MAGVIILDIAYGINVLPQNDPYVAAAERALQTVATATTTDARIIDSFPIRKCLILHELTFSTQDMAT